MAAPLAYTLSYWVSFLITCMLGRLTIFECSASAHCRLLADLCTYAVQATVANMHMQEHTRVQVAISCSIIQRISSCLHQLTGAAAAVAAELLDCWQRRNVCTAAVGDKSPSPTQTKSLLRASRASHNRSMLLHYAVQISLLMLECPNLVNS